MGSSDTKRNSVKVFHVPHHGWTHLLCLCIPHLTGAGQDVGRSCILVSIGGKNVMLDCGMHMGYNDDVSAYIPRL